MIADNETGEVVIGNDRLALRIGGSDKTTTTRQRRARERTRELREAGLLVLVRAGKGGRGRTDQVNVWRISEDGLSAAPELPERGAESRQGFDRMGGNGGGISSKRVAETRHLPTSGSPTSGSCGSDAAAAELLAGQVGDRLLASDGMPDNALDGYGLTGDVIDDLTRVIEQTRAAAHVDAPVADDVFLEAADRLAADPEPTENVGARYRQVLRTGPLREWEAGY